MLKFPIQLNQSIPAYLMHVFICLRALLLIELVLRFPDARHRHLADPASVVRDVCPRQMSLARDDTTLHVESPSYDSMQCVDTAIHAGFQTVFQCDLNCNVVTMTTV